MRLFLAFAISSIVAFNAGCGSSDSSSGSGSSSQDEDISIKQFTVVGSDGMTNPAPLNPSIGNGIFVVSGELSKDLASEIYNVELFVSNNDTLSEFDVSVAEGQCNPTDSECNTGSFIDECRYTNENAITCDIDDTVGFDVSSVVNQLPMDAYIILEACDTTGLNCDTAAAAVRFE